MGFSYKRDFTESNGAGKYCAVTVIKKPKVAGHLMNGKKKKVYENCIFLLEADQINSAKVKIKRIP